ncbi:bacterial transcriptional activator domain-containing protein [Pseudonocardia sp. NPDC046786]
MVVQVLIDEGNPACAVRHYQRFRSLVQRELGVVPSRQPTRLIAPLVSG